MGFRRRPLPAPTRGFSMLQLLIVMSLFPAAGAGPKMSTLAGTGKKGYSGDGGKATDAGMVEPNDCILDGKGGLLIADVGDWRIRRLDLATGVITTFAGTGRAKIATKVKIDRAKCGDGGPV